MFVTTGAAPPAEADARLGLVEVRGLKLTPVFVTRATG
jgi:hypothetical protein